MRWALGRLIDTVLPRRRVERGLECRDCAVRRRRGPSDLVRHVAEVPVNAWVTLSEEDFADVTGRVEVLDVFLYAVVLEPRQRSVRSSTIGSCGANSVKAFVTLGAGVVVIASRVIQCPGT